MTEKYFGQVFPPVGKWQYEGGKCFYGTLIVQCLCHQYSSYEALCYNTLSYNTPICLLYGSQSLFPRSCKYTATQPKR